MPQTLLISHFLAGMDILFPVLARFYQIGLLSSEGAAVKDHAGRVDERFGVVELMPSDATRPWMASGEVKPLFLVRNIYDILLDQYRYYTDVSPSASDHHLVQIPRKQALNLLILGGQVPGFDFPGMGGWLEQMQEMLRFAEQEASDCVLSYERFFTSPREQIGMLAGYFDVCLDAGELENCCAILAQSLAERTSNEEVAAKAFVYSLSRRADAILSDSHYYHVEQLLKDRAPDLGCLSKELGLPEVTARPPHFDADQFTHPVFVSTVFKSGTKLLEHVVEKLTGLSPVQPGMDVGSDYMDAAPIRFEEGRFFIWHNVPGEAVKARIYEEVARPVFLIRNIYDLAVAQYYHFANDVDAAIGHATRTKEYFASLSKSEGISAVLAGVRSDAFTWHGYGYYLHQTQEILRFSMEYPCHVINYDRLVLNKKAEVISLAEFLGVEPTDDILDGLLLTSSLDEMRKSRESEVGSGDHFRKGKPGDHVNELAPYHYHMINHQLHANAPDLVALCEATGFTDILELVLCYPFLSLETVDQR